MSISSNHWFNYAGFIIGAVLLLDGIFIDKLKTLSKKTPKLISILICAVMVCCTAHFVWFESKVISYAHYNIAGKVNHSGLEYTDYVIVLGAKVNGEEPSLEFRNRLNAAYEHIKNHPTAKMILTGGMGSDEDIPESAAAKKYLMRKGLAEDRILTEDKSTSTTENFIYAKDILIKNNAKPNELRIVIVSSSFHLYRASLLAKAQGFENVSFLGSKGLFYLMPHYYAREYAAYVREVLF